MSRQPGHPIESGFGGPRNFYPALHRPKINSDTHGSIHWRRGRIRRTAQYWLNESMGDWAPSADAAARNSHLLFCHHYRAELCRLQNEAWVPEDDDLKYRGPWSHAGLFTLLSAARNDQNRPASRQECATGLVNRVREQRDNSGRPSLFGLFAPVYQMLAAALTGKMADESQEALEQWLDHHAEAGFPGWRDRMGECVAAADLSDVERLCGLVYNH